MLHLDEHELAGADVLDPVGGAPLDVDRVTGVSRRSAPSRVTTAVPVTTNQCSARWAWRW